MIDPLSARSLLLNIVAKNDIVGSATGFIVEKEKKPFLITNWHVVTGRNPDTDDLVLERIPDELQIIHHVLGQLGKWTVRSEDLYLPGGKPCWREHALGKKFDVVALPIESIDNMIVIYSMDMSLADTDIIAQPAMPVSIIGFPYGLATAGAWPIWKTGHIASDPDLDYDGRPAFLIDATTRGGMSGSPVVLRLSGGYNTKNGKQILAGGIATKFLGVYSGRIHADAEIGMVWRPHVINEILENI